jgi:hypothetical protein
MFQDMLHFVIQLILSITSGMGEIFLISLDRYIILQQNIDVSVNSLDNFVRINDRSISCSGAFCYLALRIGKEHFS